MSCNCKEIPDSATDTSTRPIAIAGVPEASLKPFSSMKFMWFWYGETSETPVTRSKRWSCPISMICMGPIDQSVVLPSVSWGGAADVTYMPKP